MINRNEYEQAIREAERQHGRIVATVVCGACGARVVGTLWDKPRGLLLISQVESTELMAIELLLRAHDTGRPYEHLTPDGWTSEQVENLIRFATSQLDYQPRTSRVQPYFSRRVSLIDSPPMGMTSQAYTTSVLCPIHGTINFDSRELRDAVARRKTKKTRYVVFPQKETATED
jgi:hypothetical protein